jgi:hypothetical protein
MQEVRGRYLGSMVGERPVLADGSCDQSSGESPPECRLKARTERPMPADGLFWCGVEQSYRAGKSTISFCSEDFWRIRPSIRSLVT